MRPSSPARLYEPTMSSPGPIPGLKRRRETFHDEMLRVAGMTSRLPPLVRTRQFAVAAPINKAILRNEGRPRAATPSRRQINRTKMPESPPTSMGDGFAGEHGLVEKHLPAVRRPSAATTPHV